MDVIGAAPNAQMQGMQNAAQLNREVKLDELSKYFHLPEKAVAKELGICLTSLKKLCRKNKLLFLCSVAFHKLSYRV